MLPQGASHHKVASDASKQCSDEALYELYQVWEGNKVSYQSMLG